MSFGAKVWEFHNAFALPFLFSPAFPPSPRIKLRMDLHDEECRELEDAIVNRDVVEVADALGDIVYLAHGMAIEFGIDLDAVLAEIHASNMSKLGEDGKPILREDGKVLKGPNYFKPNLAKVLGLPCSG